MVFFLNIEDANSKIMFFTLKAEILSNTLNIYFGNPKSYCERKQKYIK